MTKEKWGRGLGLAGLVTVLLATAWQVFFESWWDQQLSEWQWYIQEEANIVLLQSVRDLASIQISTDPELRNAIQERISQRSTAAISKLIDERDERRVAMEAGQAALFSRIGNLLLLAGSALLVIGEWLAPRGNTN